MIRKVPKEFVLGAAMSAYQMEGAAAAGGREPSVWEDWLRRTVPAAHRHTSDFYHHYEEDIAACAAKGIRALSLSFSWSRIMRRDGTVNPEGLAFYDRVIDACLRHGVEPFVAGVRSYFAKHAWGNTELPDLLKELEAASGRDLSRFTGEWLQTAGVNTMSLPANLA